MYLKGIKKLFNDNTIHIEKARGSPEDNIKYCSKEGDYFVMGEPKTGGKPI